MIALMPCEEDADRLALDAPGEEPAELHLTLFYLGEGADWSEKHRADLIDRLRDPPPPWASPSPGGCSARPTGTPTPTSRAGCGPSATTPTAPTARPLEAARRAAIYALEEMHRQPDLPASTRRGSRTSPPPTPTPRPC